MQPTEVYDTIRNWIVKEGIYRIVKEHGEPANGQAWAIMIEETGDTGFGYGLTQPLTPGHVVIAGLQTPLDPYQSRINRLKPAEREELTYDVLFHLLQTDVIFEVVPNLKAVSFTQKFYVGKAAIALRWFLDRTLGG